MQFIGRARPSGPRRRTGAAAFAVLAGLAVLPGALLAGAIPPAGASSSAAPGVLSTIAGGPGSGKPTTLIQAAADLALTPGGALVLADDGLDTVVRSVSASGRYEKVLAGGGIDGAGDGETASTAAFTQPDGIAADNRGDVFVADAAANTVSVVAAQPGTLFGHPVVAGHVYRIAGTGANSGAGDGGPALDASLDQPGGLAVDGAGNLLVADTLSSEVRVVAATTGTFYGMAMTAGDIYALAGDHLYGFSGDGGPSLKASLDKPTGLAVDTAGDILIADSINQRIRVVAATTGIHYGQNITAGDIYTVAGSWATSLGDGGPATAAQLLPQGVAVDAAGDIFIADTGDSRVRLVPAANGLWDGTQVNAGDIYTIAGGGPGGSAGRSGVPATSVPLAQPVRVVIDRQGNVLVAERQGIAVRLVAHASGTAWGRPVTAGDIYTIAGGPDASGGDGAPALDAQLSQERAVVVDHAGNLVIADTADDRIRVVPASTGTFYGLPMVQGDIYTVVGRPGHSGFSGDGRPATRAGLLQPGGVAVDAVGNLVIADTWDNRIRMVPTVSGTYFGQVMQAGDIYTIAGTGRQGSDGDGWPAVTAQLWHPSAVAVDRSGDVVIADTGNDAVRVVAAASGTYWGQAIAANAIYAVAGLYEPGYAGDHGPANLAELRAPGGVAVDGNGNLLIADTGNNRVRAIAGATGGAYGQALSAGEITTIAGNGTAGDTGDGGPATAAEIDPPGAVAIGPAASVLVATGGQVRAVTQASGTYYGQAIGSGNIGAVAGDPQSTIEGDGGPATAALLGPAALTTDAAGNLVLADQQWSDRIRAVAGP